MAKVKKKVKTEGSDRPKTSKKVKVKKKAKLSSKVVTKDVQQEAQETPSLRDWLVACGTSGLDFLEVRPLREGFEDLGLFLTKDVEEGEVLLSVPEICVLDCKKALEDEVLAAAFQRLKSLQLEISDNFFVCLRLLLASQRPTTDPWNSLAAEMKRWSQSRAGPRATEWPEAFQAMMAKTTLKDHLDAAKEDLKTWQGALKKLKEGGLAERSISPDTLVLAHHFCAAHLSNDGRLRPWYGLLVQDSSANVQMKTDASTFGYELVAASKIKAGSLLSLGTANFDNTTLLLRYGFAVSNNPKETIMLKEPEKTPGIGNIALSCVGIPADVVDRIEAEQDTQQFVSILKGTLELRRTVQENLKILPQALNFTVCKGPVLRKRKEYLQIFLEGQLAILQHTLEQMQDAEDGDENGEPDDELGDQEEEEEEEVVYQPRKRRRRR